MNFKTLWKYNGLFEKCTLEPAIHGFSIFHKGGFLGMIEDDCFYINTEYEHSDKLHAELAKRGVTVVDYETGMAIRNENEIAEALYGEPK